MDRSSIYAIETPPPSVSGFLHAGHALCFARLDITARHQRAMGCHVHFVMGWDDCEPAADAYIARTLGIRPADGIVDLPPGTVTTPVPRAEWDARASALLDRTEQEYEQHFRRLGISADWSRTWRARDPHTWETAQTAFLEHDLTWRDGAWWAHHDTTALRAADITWHPATMRDAYQAAITDAPWRVSRRGVSGVPVPAWVLADGTVVYADALPVDPRVTAPPGMDEAGRDTAFTDCGVLDTWWTSSLAPRITTPDLVPFDLRHQGRDILARAIIPAIGHTGTPPWREVTLTGWVSADTGKMSKSRGWTYLLGDLLDEWGQDAVRYWAAMVPPGGDTVVDDAVLVAGRRLADAIRVRPGGEPVDPGPAHRALDDHDPAAALAYLEAAFWAGGDVREWITPIMPGI